MAATRISPEQHDRERARVEQIEREARQDAVEREARQERDRQSLAAEVFRERVRDDRPGAVPLLGATVGGEPRAIKVDAQGYVIVRLATEDLAALRSVIRLAGEDARGDVRARQRALDQIRAAVEQLLARYSS